MSRDVGYNLGRAFGSIPDPQSAYDDLVTQMHHAEGGFIWTREEAKALVDAVLNEAAEKIRCADAPDECENTFDAGAVWASELIRPTGKEPLTEPVPIEDTQTTHGVRVWAEELDAWQELAK